MNYVSKNRINTYIYMYGLKDSEENFKKLDQVIEEKEYNIYKKVLYIIDNCRIVEEDSTGIIVEIDLFEYRKLLEDLTNKFFTKKLGNRKFEKKIGDGYFVGNTFLTVKIYNGFGFKKIKTLVKSVYYKLLSTSYIFTYNAWNYCKCYQFQGCRFKPRNSLESGERYYCYICRVGV